LSCSGGGVESGGVSEFELFLLFFAFLNFAAFVLFVGFATFSPLDDLLELFLSFGLLVVLHVSWIQNSNFGLLLSLYSSNGRLRNQVVSTLV
jgi:hypothetical protein